MPSGDSIPSYPARQPQGTDLKQTPARLLIILVVAVFAIEMSIMVAFTWLPPLPAWLETLLDATLLSALLFPVLYCLVFRPLRMLNTQQIAVQHKLEQQLDELQRFHKVTMGRELRMKELYEENQALKAQIEEQGK